MSSAVSAFDRYGLILYVVTKIIAVLPLGYSARNFTPLPSEARHARSADRLREG
jgi:hypothetical protein